MGTEQAGGGPGSGAVSDRMRALLSRAAQEQLHEQRQVSTVLGELRALVTDVDERLATAEQLERLTGQVQALSARLDAADARSTALADRLEVRVGELTAGVTASVEGVLARTERRLGAHVDDAVLALAEVVLRRRRSAAPADATAGDLPDADAAQSAADPAPVRLDDPAPADDVPTADGPPAGATDQARQPDHDRPRRSGGRAGRPLPG